MSHIYIYIHIGVSVCSHNANSQPQAVDSGPDFGGEHDVWIHLSFPANNSLVHTLWGPTVGNTYILTALGRRLQQQGSGRCFAAPRIEPSAAPGALFERVFSVIYSCSLTCSSNPNYHLRHIKYHRIETI